MNCLFLDHAIKIANTLELTESDRELIECQVNVIKSLYALSPSVYCDRLVEIVKSDLKQSLISIHTCNNLERIALG